MLAGDSTHLLSMARGKHHFMRQEEDAELAVAEETLVRKFKKKIEDGGDGMKGVGNVFCTTRSRLSKSNLIQYARFLQQASRHHAGPVLGCWASLTRFE